MSDTLRPTSGPMIAIAPSGAIGGPAAVAVIMHRICGLSSSAKLVAAAIAKRTKTADPDAGAWPSMALLRSETGRSLPTIRRAIREAIAAGWLRVSRASSARLSRCYVVTVPPTIVGPLLAANDIEAADAVSPPEGEHPSTETHQGRGNTMFPQRESYVPSEGKPCSPRGKATFPEYIREDSREDSNEDPKGEKRASALPPSVPPVLFDLAPTEPEKSPRARKGRKGKNATPKAQRVHECPEDFAPGATALAAAAEHGLDDAQIERERRRFVNHFRATGKRYVRWEQAFINWLERSQNFPNGRALPGVSTLQQPSRCWEVGEEMPDPTDREATARYHARRAFGEP